MNKHEVETLLGLQAGQTVLMAALIQTHPAPVQLQLATASLLEIFLNGEPGRTLSERQQALARGYVEELMRLDSKFYADPTKTFQL